MIKRHIIPTSQKELILSYIKDNFNYNVFSSNIYPNPKKSTKKKKKRKKDFKEKNKSEVKKMNLLDLSIDFLKILIIYWI